MALVVAVGLAIGVPSTATAATVDENADRTWQTVGSLDARGRNESGRVEVVEYGRKATAGRVFLGGAFTKVEPPRDRTGSARTRLHLASFGVRRGNLIGRFNVAVRYGSDAASARVVALALSPDGKVLYLGGRFTSVNGKRRLNLAAVNAKTGRLLKWRPSASRGVHSLEVGAGRVYVGGTFTAVNGQQRQHLAAVSARGRGRLLSWSPAVRQVAIDCPPRCAPDVYAMQLSPDGNILYFGGSFATVNGRARNSAAAVTTSSGKLGKWNPNVFTGGKDSSLNTVRDLELAGKRVFLCGDFWLVDSVASPNVAAVTRGRGDLIARFDAGADGSVNACALHRKAGLLFIGGHFDRVGERSAIRDGGGTVRHHLAALMLRNGNLHGWDPNANSVPGAFGASTQGGKVAFGGDFTTINGQEQKGFAQFGISS